MTFLVDGANSDWRDSLRRAEELEEHGVHFVDAGVSGGVWGLRIGYNLMVGAKDEAFRNRRAYLTYARARGRLRPRRPQRVGALRQDGP